LSVETDSKTLRNLLWTRALCLVLMALLLYALEDPAVEAVRLGWMLLLVGAVLSLPLGVLARSRRLSGPLIPLMFVLDGALLAVWVAVSGGTVSFYLPFFLLPFVGATLTLSPRRGGVVVLLLLFEAFVALYLSHEWRLPEAFGTGAMNFVSAGLEGLPPGERGEREADLAFRWAYFFLMVVAVCALLTRQIWAREERLRVREKALEQKRHLIQMGELTGRLAHGVNTPLGLISGNLEMMLAETPKRGKAWKKLTEIQRYAQRAIATVRDILAFGRQSMSEIRPTELPRVVQAVAAAVQPKLKRSGGKLVLDLAPDLPALMAYPEGLFQALLNLVENALDSIPAGGVVTLSARFLYRSLRLSAEDRRGEVQLVVRDTGRGIPSRELKRIFEPYYSTKGFGKGTGLGLSIVKRIVEEHGGSITVESKEGEWTQFTLTLPTDGPKERGEGAGMEGYNVPVREDGGVQDPKFKIEKDRK
jgi:signal transduction histidine kinase